MASITETTSAPAVQDPQNLQDPWMKHLEVMSNISKLAGDLILDLKDCRT